MCHLNPAMVVVEETGIGKSTKVAQFVRKTCAFVAIFSGTDLMFL